MKDYEWLILAVGCGLLNNLIMTIVKTTPCSGTEVTLQCIRYQSFAPFPYILFSFSTMFLILAGLGFWKRYKK